MQGSPSTCEQASCQRSCAIACWSAAYESSTESPTPGEGEPFVIFKTSLLRLLFCPYCIICSVPGLEGRIIPAAGAHGVMRMSKTTNVTTSLWQWLWKSRFPQYWRWHLRADLDSHVLSTRVYRYSLAKWCVRAGSICSVMHPVCCGRQTDLAYCASCPAGNIYAFRPCFRRSHSTRCSAFCISWTVGWNWWQMAVCIQCTCSRYLSRRTRSHGGYPRLDLNRRLLAARLHSNLPPLIIIRPNNKQHICWGTKSYCINLDGGSISVLVKDDCFASIDPPRNERSAGLRGPGPWRRAWRHCASNASCWTILL